MRTLIAPDSWGLAPEMFPLQRRSISKTWNHADDHFAKTWLAALVAVDINTKHASDGVLLV